MAVTATFQADFSDFLRKSREAGDSIEKLQAAAGSTTGTIKRMGESFAGETIIRRAADAVTAIKDMGGVSALTQGEMQRLGVQLGEASQKMERLGITVPSAMKSMQAEIKAATDPSMLERFDGALGKIGLSLGMVTAGALVAFAKGAVEAADNVGDVAEKTGLSTDAVQRFQQAFGQSGIALEDIAKSASKLSMKLAKGDDSTETAVKALGLSLYDLRNKTPEEAFKTVATALAGVDDQGRKTAIATELLGKGMGAAAGAFNETNIAAMATADVLGGESIDAASRLSDAQKHLTHSLQNAVVDGIAPLLPALAQLMDWTGQLAHVISAVLKYSIDGLVLSFQVLREYATSSLASLLEGIQKLPFADKIPGAEKLAGAIAWLKDDSKSASDTIAKLLNPALDASAKGQETLSKRVGEYNEKSKERQSDDEETTTQIERLTKSLHAQIEAYEKTKQAIDKVAATPEWFKLQKASLVETEPVMSRTIAQTGEIVKKQQEWAAANLQVIPTMHGIGKAAEEVVSHVSKLGDAWSKAGATIVGALQGGGNPLKALGASLGSAFGEDLGAMAAKAIGGKLGSAIGSAMGPLGAMAGQLLGAGMTKAMGWIKGLFSDPMKKEIAAANAEIDKLKAKLLEHGDSVDSLEEKFNALGLSIREAWSKGGKEGLAAMQDAVKVFNERLAESKTHLADLEGQLTGQRDKLAGLIGDADRMGYKFNEAGQLVGINFKVLSDTAKQFGIDVAALGPAFQQAQLSEQAQRVIDGFTLLDKAGVDTGTILVGMKDEISKIVNDSLKFGTTIPANMQPWIKELMRTGQLTDENGNKITDLSRIKFGQPVKTEYEKITDAIHTVLDAMSDLIGQISNLTASIAAATASRTMTVTAQYVDPGPPPGFGDPTRGRGGSSDAPEAWFGGGVTASGIQRFASGGLVGGVGEGDTVPAMLTPGEGVLSRRGMQALAKLNHGGSVGADPALREEMRAMRHEFAQAARALRDLPRAIKLGMQEAALLA